MTEQNSKKPFIMVVDDEEDTLTIFARHLANEGHNVHAFSNPVIALEHFRYSPHECSLIISDVRMPGISGFELARKVKALNPDVKVILTSAFEINVSEFEKMLPNTPIDGFLDKPVQLNKISELVRQELQVQ